MPPVPVVVEKIVVHVVASGDVWIWNALPNAVSQFNTTWQMDCVEPRSTWSHCGSLNWLDQRVVRLPSTAAEAGVPAFSVDEAVAVLFSARFVPVLQVPPVPFTVQVNEVEPEAPVPSVALTVTFEVPAVVGVPEIRPDEELIDSPAGRPEAL